MENPYASPERVTEEMEMRHAGLYGSVRIRELQRALAGLGWTLYAVLLGGTTLTFLSVFEWDPARWDALLHWRWFGAVWITLILCMVGTGGMYLLGAVLCSLTGWTQRWRAPLLVLGGLILSATGETYLFREPFLEYGSLNGLQGLAWMTAGAALWCWYLCWLTRTLHAEAAKLWAHAALVLCILTFCAVLTQWFRDDGFLLEFLAWGGGCSVTAYVILHAMTLVILRRTLRMRIRRLNETGYEE